MRLGAQAARLLSGSVTAQAYNNNLVQERHRHRYEINADFVPQLEHYGLVIAGYSEDTHLVEVIELKEHPWFVGCQFHPEFTSNPLTAHPLFISYIRAVVKQRL